MKKLFLIITVGVAFALCAGCGGEVGMPTDEATVMPTGVARLCRPIAEDQYILLYNVPAQKGSEGASEETDSFYLYDAEKNTFQYLTSGADLWEGPDYHLSVTDDHLLYQTGSGRLFSITLDGKGELSEQTKSEEAPYVISPDGTKYVIRQDDGVKVYDLQQDTLLVQAEGVTDVLAMEWSEDSSRVAMVTNGGAAVAVWDMNNGETFVYDALQSVYPPDGWVDIIRAYVIGDEPILLVDYLCESGRTFIFWDMSTDWFTSQIETNGDATILDISGNRVLYEVIPEDGPHTLSSYQCSSKEHTVLDQYQGFYTAGCFGGQGDQALVFRYDTKAKTGELVRVPSPTPVPTPELTGEPNIAALQVEELYGQITKDGQFTMTLVVNDGVAGSYPAGGWNWITSITDERSGYQWEQSAEPDIPPGTDQLIFSREEQRLVFYDLDGLVKYREGENSQWYKSILIGDNVFDANIYHYLRRWYDTTELAELQEQIMTVPDDGRSIDEIAQACVEAYEGIYLRLAPGSIMRWTFMKINNCRKYEGDEPWLEGLNENTVPIVWSTIFVPESDGGYFMAGNTEYYTGSDPEVPEGALQWWRVGYLQRDEDGFWRCDGGGTGW